MMTDDPKDTKVKIKPISRSSPMYGVALYRIDIADPMMYRDVRKRLREAGYTPAFIGTGVTQEKLEYYLSLDSDALFWWSTSFEGYSVWLTAEEQMTYVTLVMG